MERRRSQSLVALVVLLAACGGTTTAPEDAGVGVDTGAGIDASTGVDSAVEASADVCAADVVSNPCAPGTCRFKANPSGECLPPGGPIGLPDAAPSLSGCCMCGADGFCSQECQCAAPDTPIATPSGDRPIASLAVGDLVYSIDHGRLAAVPIRETHHTAVTNHRVIEVVLEDGAVLRISAAHPTADGRSFGDLRANDWLGGALVRSATVVPYDFDATYDILPDSDTATYFARGALIGSTLAKRARAAKATQLECTVAVP
jgi:hypothetical protein